jgi:hypothetical protein
MSANNPVFQVLIPTGDQAVLAAGSRVTALAVGQIGVFSAETGLSLNAAGVANERAIFLAVGVDEDGDTVMDSIRVSAGQNIQRKGVTDYTLRCYNPERAHIVDITDFSGIQCESSYTFKVEFRGNTQAYQNYGFNQFAKTFSVRTGCCGAGCDCPDGDCNELAELFVNAVNADTDGIVKADYLDFTTTPGSPVVVAAAGVDAWIVANPGLCLGVRLTSVASKLYAYCNIPLRYYKMRQFKMTVSVLEPLSCKAVTATFQEPSFGEGQGTDIGWLEYEAGGWNGKPGPYRVGELVGTALGEFERFSTNGAIYNQVNLHYMNEVVAGWEQNKSKLNTIIAIPCTNGANVTLTALLTILDAFTDNFDALVDDVALCTCNTVAFTSAASVTTDGIG